MAKVDYLGYDPKIIKQWYAVYLKYPTELTMRSFLVNCIPEKYRAVVASMLTLSRWIVEPNYEIEKICPLCTYALKYTCEGCLVEETFGHIECAEYVNRSNTAKYANKIYIAEYRKAFGDEK